MTESDLVSAILNEFGSRPGIRLWRQNTGVAKDKTGRVIRFGVPGQADIQGILAPSGKFIAIEAKTATGRQSDKQKKWGAMVTRHGGIYILARSLADVERALTC